MGIIYEKKGHIAYITIDNPQKANVLDKSTSDEIAQAWKDVWDDRQVRVAILTASGDRHFCAGHDLSAREQLTPEERRRRAVERIFWPPSGTVFGMPIGVDGRSGDHYPQIWKPVIAAVNGWAVGAGFYLLLTSTDIRIACEEHARFRYGLLSRGWLGGGPGAARLVRQIAHVDAMRILLIDEPFDAREALRIHLINEVVPHDRLMVRAEELASQIVKMPPVAVRMMKEFLIRFRDVSVDEAWHVSTLMDQLVNALTTDPEEGRRAFRERREPEYTGGLRYPDDDDVVS